MYYIELYQNMDHDSSAVFFTSFSPLSKFEFSWKNWTASFVFWNEFNIINFNSVVILNYYFIVSVVVAVVFLCFQRSISLKLQIIVIFQMWSVRIQRERTRTIFQREINVYFIFSIWHYVIVLSIDRKHLLQHLYSSERNEFWDIFYYV